MKVVGASKAITRLARTLSTPTLSCELDTNKLHSFIRNRLRESSCLLLSTYRHKKDIVSRVSDPSSIYSCYIGHIWEHKFCHLGCWAVSEKILKRRNVCLSMLLFGVVFHVFMSKKLNFRFVFLHCSVRTKKLL